MDTVAELTMMFKNYLTYGNPRLGEFVFATSLTSYIPFVATELHVGGSNISILVSQSLLSPTPDQCKQQSPSSQ